MTDYESMKRAASMLADGAGQEVRCALEVVVHEASAVAKYPKKSWLRHPFVLAMLVITAYLPVAYYLQESYVSKTDATVMRPPFRHLAGNSYSSFHLVRGSIGDSEKFPNRSTLDLFENEKKLGPEHSPHHTISTKGGGAYSQWFTGNEGYIIIFSTSDNTDPNTNGRTYRALVR